MHVTAGKLDVLALRHKMMSEIERKVEGESREVEIHMDGDTMDDW